MFRKVASEVYDADRDIFTAFLQRIKPVTITSYQTRSYMRKIGLIEIVMKTLILVVSLGAAIVIRHHKRQVQRHGTHVHIIEKKKKFSRRFPSKTDFSNGFFIGFLMLPDSFCFFAKSQLDLF